MDEPKKTDSALATTPGGARLDALQATGLLDSGADDAFDRLTRLAAKVLHVPVALVSLVDRDRQFFKSCVGLPEPWATARQTPLSHSFCQHAVESGKPLIISDARRHPLVKDNLAVRDLSVIAYAGIPLATPEGHVLGSFCVIDAKPRDWLDAEIDILHDLAAAVMTEIGLKQAKEAAEAANRAKDRFLAVLSHELRTPISPALMIATAMAEDRSLPPQAREDADTIRRNIRLQTRLIDDLLDVTRIEHGKLALRTEPLDLDAVLADCVDICGREAAAKGVAVSLLPATGRCFVRGDPVRLRQVFCNLIKNAVKFTPPAGSVTVQAAAPPGGRAAVTVRDTGIGIDPQVLPHVFKPFEQGERAITNEFSGLGLGLAITKGIVEAHGGRIAAESGGKGRGTSMTVELPAAPPSVAAAAEAPEARARRSTGTAPKPQPTILLVDDHRDTLNAMSRLLRRLDYGVTTADSKASALAAAAGQDFDLLISDIGLPDGTGLELMRELLARRPITGIALTGYGTESDVEMTREAGFAAHLTKPINMQDVEAVIRRLAS